MLLLILLVLALISSIVYKYSTFQKVIFVGIIFTIPTPWFNQISNYSLFTIFSLSFFCVLYLISHKDVIKNIAIISLTLFSTVLLITNSQVINYPDINPDRTSWVDNNNNSILVKFEKQSTILPYRLRPIIWGQWWQLSDFFTRGLTGIGGNYLVPTTGIFLWVIVLVSIFIAPNFKLLSSLYLTICVGWLSRNPNISSIALQILPIMIIVSASVLKKLHFQNTK